MSDFSKSAIYTLLTQIPTQLFGIIAGILITRILGPDGRGVYSIFYADVSLFATLLGFNINMALIHYTATKEIAREKLLAISILFSILTMVLSLVTLGIWLNISVADLLFPTGYISWEFISWFILFLLFTQINTVYSSFLQGVKRFDVVNRVLLFNSAINIILFGIAYYLDSIGIMHVGLFEILIIGLVVLVLNTLQWHVHFRKYITYKCSFKLSWKEDIKRFFNYTGLGHLSISINFFNYRLVLWIIAAYLDNAQVGFFSLAAGLAQMLFFLTAPLTQVLMPYMSSETREQRLLIFQRFSRIHFSIILAVALFTIIIAPFVIPLLYGKEFSASIVPFNIMIFGIVLSCQTRVFSTFFASENKMHVNLYATIVGFVLTFAFNFLLIERYHTVGAAIAQSITFAGIFLFIYLVLVRFVRIGAVNLFLVTKNDLIYAWKKLTRKP